MTTRKSTRKSPSANRKPISKVVVTHSNAGTRSTKRKKTTRQNAEAKPSHQGGGLNESALRQNPAFREASSKAESYANDPEKMRKLFEEASAKAKSIPRGPFAETWAYLMAMLRLIRAYYRGVYREIPWQSLVLIIVAIIYFVSPIDLIPDFIPVAGYIDDAFVIGLVLKSVKDDMDAFMEWEARQA